MDGTLKERVDSIVRGQVIGVQTEIQSFNFFFGIQVGILVLRYTGDSSSALQYTWTGEWKGGRGAGSNRDLFCIISTNVV